MPQYSVIWTIDLDAETELDAAELAFAIQRNPESTATFFNVIESNHARHISDGALREQGYLSVDLNEYNNPAANVQAILCSKWN